MKSAILLGFLGFLMWAFELHAQVSTTATVTLTVLPASGVELFSTILERLYHLEEEVGTVESARESSADAQFVFDSCNGEVSLKPLKGDSIVAGLHNPKGPRRVQILEIDYLGN